MEDLQDTIDNFKDKNEIVIIANKTVKGLYYPWLTVCGSKAMVAYKQKAKQFVEYKYCPYLCPNGFTSKYVYFYTTEIEALQEGIRIAYKLITNGKETN